MEKFDKLGFVKRVKKALDEEYGHHKQSLIKDYCKVSQSVASYWLNENHPMMPKAMNQIRLCELCKRPLNWIIHGVPPERVNTVGEPSAIYQTHPETEEIIEFLLSPDTTSEDVQSVLAQVRGRASIREQN